MSRHLSLGGLIAVFVGFFVGWTFGAVVGGQREFGMGFCVLFGLGYEVYRDTDDDTSDTSDRNYEDARETRGGGSLLPEDRDYEEPDELARDRSASPE